VDYYARITILLQRLILFNYKSAVNLLRIYTIFQEFNNMNYLQYYPTDVINGEGTRCTLFVSGCTHGCKGCYNQKSWSFSAGVLFDEAMEQQIINDLKDTRIKRQGLTLSGGDPLHPLNVETLLPFVQRVKRECPDKDIWVWTGYKLDELDEQQRAMLPYIDVLIDGKFIQEQADPSLVWRGSANQVIHRFKL
jgi:anaerobic ribonucleoside-triphosphate reductase activating protein